MQAIESTLEIHVPGINKIATKRRINPWFDHAVHQLKSKEEQQRKNGSETKLKKTKKYSNVSIKHTRPTFKIKKGKYKGKSFRSKYKLYKGIL